MGSVMEHICHWLPPRLSGSPGLRPVAQLGQVYGAASTWPLRAWVTEAFLGARVLRKETRGPAVPGWVGRGPGS